MATNPRATIHRRPVINLEPPRLPTKSEIFTPALDEKVTKRLKEAYDFPELSELNKGRKHTFTLGKCLEILINTGKLQDAAAIATTYVFFGYSGHEVDITTGTPVAEEYNRSLNASKYLLTAFTNHLRDPEKPSMLLGDLPKATHSFLVARRAARIPWPRGWSETGRMVCLFHDLIEDTETALRGQGTTDSQSVEALLTSIYRRTGEQSGTCGEEREHQRNVVENILGSVELLTRSDLFYLLTSQRILGMRDKFPYEQRLIAAIAKQEDRYVNNRSIEPFLDQERFPFRKVIKELGKSLWVADYLGKSALRQLHREAITDEQHLFRTALRSAVTDNLRSLYGALLSARTELEQRIHDDDKQEGERLMRSIRETVASYGRRSGFERITSPRRRIQHVGDPRAPDGTLVKIFSLMYPTAEAIKRAAALAEDPRRESVALKRSIFAGSPSWLLPPRWRSGYRETGITDEEVHDAYAAILNRQEWSRELFEKARWQYLTIYTLQKIVERHLAEPAYSLLRPKVMPPVVPIEAFSRR